MSSEKMDSSAKERLRRRYRPGAVQILFVGESRPASGRFFYQADSGLYRAVRETFVAAFPALEQTDFLDAFRALGCYLVDLCGEPVDRMTPRARRNAHRAGEVRLARTIRSLRPQIMVTVARSICANVGRAQEQAGWSGPHLELPYPGRWYRNRLKFRRHLIPVLRKSLNGNARPGLTRESGPHDAKARETPAHKTTARKAKTRETKTPETKIRKN